MSSDTEAKTVKFHLRAQPYAAVAFHYRVVGQLRPNWLTTLETNMTICCADTKPRKSRQWQALLPKGMPPVSEVPPVTYTLNDWVVLTTDGDVRVLSADKFAATYEAV